MRRLSDLPTYRPDATEHILTGIRLLRGAFLEMPPQSAERDQPIVGRDPVAPPILLLQRGVAYCACTLPNGKRSILDLVLPGDFAGIDHIVMRRPDREIVAASGVVYRCLAAGALRELATTPAVSFSLLGLMAEARVRSDGHVAALARLQARERLCTMLLDVHDRLRRRELISRPTFNLPLTQDQMADYLGLTMVHVNRTLRQLREERLALIDRQVVIIMDLPRLREIVHGLSPAPAGTTFDAIEEAALLAPPSRP